MQFVTHLRFRACRSLVAAGALAAVVFAPSANATPLSGGLAVSGFGGGSSFTSSSVTLSSLNLITQATGDLSAAPAFSDLTASSTTISGLSSTPLAVPVTDFFVFSSPDSFFMTSGTTPTNRFEFDLATLSETGFVAGTTATFSGTGTLIDTTGALDPAPATFTVGFGGANNYSFTFNTVPEPASCGLVAAGLFGALASRRRRSV